MVIILSSSPTTNSINKVTEAVDEEHQLTKEKEKQGEKPKIRSLQNGPYYLLNNTKPKIVGNLQNSKGEPLSTVMGVALCRRGASKNKPFCDGTHSIIGFSSEN